MGASFSEHADLIGALCVVVIVGTLLGEYVLFSVSRDLLIGTMKLFITLLSLYLVLKGSGVSLTEPCTGSLLERSSVLAMLSL